MSRNSKGHSGRLFWGAGLALTLALVCSVGAFAAEGLTGAGSTWVYPLAEPQEIQ